mgnify:CR=1 FL=1
MNSLNISLIILVIGLFLLTSCSKQQGETPLIPEFSSDKVNIMAGEAISFSDISEGNVTSREWVLEGGRPATTNVKNPVVIYDQPGTYAVRLTVNSASRSETITKQGYVQVGYAALKADFDVDKLIVLTGEEVTFSDKSNGMINTWKWEFISSEGIILHADTQHPVISFQQAGMYTVKLTVANPNHSDIIIKEDYIEVKPYEAPEMHTTLIFTQGMEGYHSYRIPCLAKATNGNLIAFAEGRKHTSLDYGDIDLVYKLSYDNGQNWSALKILIDEGEGTWGNPTAVTDQETGRIWLFLSWNGDSHAQNGGSFGGKTYAPIDTWGQRRVFTIYSDDHGETWTSPIDRTTALLPPGYTWDAMGPGIGIQVEKGTAKGRLIIPAGGRNIYSDDHGITWHYKTIPGGTFEGTIVELNNGLLMRNDRGVAGTWANSRTRFISLGTIEGSFSAFSGDVNLPDSRCQASIIRYSWSPSCILFLNTANDSGDGMPYRCRMTVRISYDEGVNWAVSRLLYPELTPVETCEQGYGGYSSMILTADNYIGALVEHNTNPTAGAAINRRHSIHFNKFNLNWVLNGSSE